MLDDRILMWRLRRGSDEALGLIYQKYFDDLLTMAVSLLGDVHGAEDVVQEVFIGFGRSSSSFRLKGSLRSYLAVCVANRVRDIFRARQRHRSVGLFEAEYVASGETGPAESVMGRERKQRVREALVGLPFEQREVIIWHLQGGMKFREIAAVRQESIKTVQSRYRYGLEKMRSLLDKEVCDAKRR